MKAGMVLHGINSIKKTHIMIVVNKVYVGENPRLGGLKVYRSARMEECFLPQCYVNIDNDGLTNQSQIRVGYKEWCENELGEEIVELTKKKSYILKDETIWKPVSEFLTNFCRNTPTPPNDRGFGDQIENTLANIPFDVEDCYVVKSTDFIN